MDLPPSDRVWPTPAAACTGAASGELADTPAFREYLHREFPEQASEWNDPKGRRAVPEADERVAGPRRRRRLHQAATRGHRPLRAPAGGYRPGPAAVFRQRHPVLRYRASGAGRKPHGASDQDRRQSGASGEPRRDRHLHAGGGSWLIRPGSRADGHSTAVRCAPGASSARRCVGSRRAEGHQRRRPADPSGADHVAVARRADGDGARARYPQARWHQYDPMSRDGARTAARQAAGPPERGDLPLRQGRRRPVARRRLPGVRARQRCATRAISPTAAGSPTSKTTMNRLYAVESTPSLTGAKADHRLPMRASDVEGFARRSPPRIGAGVGAGGAAAASMRHGSRRSPRICRRIAARRWWSPATTSPPRCTPRRTR